MSSSSQSTPFITEEARSQRSRATSSCESSTGGFGISNVRNRVGAPPLRPLPLACIQDPPCIALRAELGTDLEEKAQEILVKYMIPKPEVVIISRVVPGDPRTATPAIYIVATWSDDDSRQLWQKVVEELKRYIDDRLAGVGRGPLKGMDVCVEMIAEELTWPKYMSPIPKDESFPKLAADWPIIQDKVSDLLGMFRCTASNVITISLFKLGFDCGYTTNPKTVYVSVEYESSQLEWPPVVEKIQGYLDTLGHGLHLHLEHNTLSRFTFPLMPGTLTEDEKALRLEHLNFRDPSSYKTQVDLGVDISAAQYIRRADGKYCFPLLGTLGCYLEIKSRRYRTWTEVALTNYHVVRPTIKGYQLGTKPGSKGLLRSARMAPAKDSDLWEADLKGFSPKTMEDRKSMEHPPRARHNFFVQNLQDALERNPSSEFWKKSLQDKLVFFDKGHHKFAGVWAGSGFMRRTKSGGLLDWALLMPHGTRIGTNRLPDDEKWSLVQLGKHLPIVPKGGMSLQAPPKEDAQSEGKPLRIQQGDYVYKVGATTGATVGYFNELKTVCYAEAKHMTVKPPRSLEFSFIGLEPEGRPVAPFAAPGDSGAVVFDETGRAVGLLFSGQTPQQCSQGQGHGFVTPIEDVLEDIQKFSNGQITDIRIAEF